MDGSCCWTWLLMWAAFTTICAQIKGVGGLKNVRVVSPGAVAVGETAALECQYDLEGAELYAVKWYKGKKEFYRYLPKEKPPTKVFPLPGINVDLSESDAHHVVLRDAGFTLTGRYRCEVSTDAPSFDTALVVASLVIVDFPDGEPIITAERSSYAVGEMVRANCTVEKSHPPANLTWSVNGRRVRGRHILRYPLRRDGEGNATTTTLGLEVEAGSGTFRQGRLTLRCQATLLSAYNATAHMDIEEERPKPASVLGNTQDDSSSAPAPGAASSSRNSAAPSLNARTEGCWVMAASLAALATVKALSIFGTSC
ncbi:uncharacterized protein LOC124153728 isoform X1 [Ischnura elegans]|uniref:uncharacterized protein LOC124153728 isoform X1 n=1 Tax=Ischnura elegans TaxID=197161 RepID=UPI001ED86B3C|nr:uncharacterized protein LOC124153728 isoform X1 [Ischnura elegans]